MAVRAPVRISQKIMVPLSAIMVVAAGLAYFDGAIVLVTGDNARLFTTSRMPTGEHFLTYRQRTAPLWVYRGLHALPAIIWSIGMPLQHVDSLRKKWPALHRVAGYTLLSISLLLSITGYWFFISKHAYSHQNLFHLHSFNGLSPVPWPTFAVSTSLVGPFYWLTMYKTAATARARDFARHRKWAVLHTLCASVISAERLSLVILYAVGFALTLLPQAAVHDFFGVGYTVKEIAEAELSLFALGNVLALVMVLSWLYYDFGRAGYFGRAESGRSVAEAKAQHAKKVM
ncbi:Fungal transcriptional regulatory protein [Cordyceps javanica]|uniref:Fungal transcriptional regulatory protein n=1 Tax=Cordyceps javanica TaxID=43265 RepID=A0A545UP84_9HYPO|nr:Fungal transcriptional regulatory protein [Cordyceps javanica]TQW02934.1 Fungal transcriptional regulatory protein [Cordyceps javanica]